MASKRRRFTKGQKAGIRFSQGGICPWCNEFLNMVRHTIEYDHWIPLELGGADDLENVNGMHKPCHTEKTRKDIKDIAKAKRVAAKHQGTYRASRNPIRGNRQDHLKRKVGGGVVVRATGAPL